MCFRCRAMDDPSQSPELKNRLADLQREQEKTLEILASLTLDNRMQFYATEEVKIHYQSAANHLSTIYKKGWRVKEDFSAPQNLFDVPKSPLQEVFYLDLYTHFHEHQTSGRDVPEQIKAGTFSSLFFSINLSES